VKIKFELLRLPVIEYLIESMKINDGETQIFALEGLKVFLEYGKDIKISYENKENIVKKQIEHVGISLIEKCAGSLNKDVSEIATFLLNTYILKDESNKINN
jgi:hypothetical protein